MPDERETRLISGEDGDPARDEPGSEHQHWLAMQAAHNQYLTASTALDALVALSPGGFPSSERSLQIEMVAAEQRTAFESYIDARLQLSELLVSRRILVPPPAPSVSQGGATAVRSGVSGTVILAVLAAFLFPTAFGVGYLARERTQIHTLEAARDQANTLLAQTRTEIQSLAGKVEALKSGQQAAVREAVTRAIASVRQPQAPHPAAKRPLVPAAVQVARNHQELMQLQRRGERSYYEFSVNPRRRFERIGPIGLTVLNVDTQRRYFDVAIAVDDQVPSRKRMNLYQQIWIERRGQPKALEMVINRIDDDEIQGYVSEPRYPRLSGRAMPLDAGILWLP